MKELFTLESLNKKLQQNLKKGKEAEVAPNFSNYLVMRNGDVYSKSGRLIKTRSKNGSDRQRIDLINDAGERVTMHVSQLVFSAFTGVRHNIISQVGQVDHIDNDRTHDSVYNLQLLSKASNLQKYNQNRQLVKNLFVKKELEKRAVSLKKVA